MRILLTFVLLLIATAAPAYNWEYVGMNGVNATSLTVDPVHNRVLVGTMEGFWYYDQASSLWTERDMEGSIGRTVWAVDYNDTLPEFVVTGRENAWFKGYMEYSEDLGDTDNFAYESTGGMVTDVIHSGQTYWACTSSDVVDGELLRSSDGGMTWAPIAGHGFHTMANFTFNFGPGELVLAGDASVKISYTQGDTWQDITGNLPSDNGVHCVEGFFPGGDAWPAYSLFASTDLGIYFTEWNEVWLQTLDVSCRDMASIPPAVSYMGADRLSAVTWDGRIMVSIDGWTDETENLPGTPVAIAYSPNDRGLYVATATNGVWRYLGVGPHPGSVNTPERVSLELQAHPNPFNPGTTLSFSLTETGPIDLRIFDVAGREMAILAVGPREAGEYTVDWHAVGFPSGTYLACLKIQGVRATQKLVLLK
ncbi:MAG: T9SS type A sorting domain-containing protein [bacterium]|nr:T9SS type A sorting domain-containing protein [bacterium]